MMRIFLFILLTGLISCHKEDCKKTNYSLVGKWKRIETFASPGNGGGWQKDQSNPAVAIEFAEGGKFISNADFYSNFTSYKINADSSVEFSPPMNGLTKAVYYSMNSNTQLTLTFACIEGCGDRFIRY